MSRLLFTTVVTLLVGTTAASGQFRGGRPGGSPRPNTSAAPQYNRSMLYSTPDAGFRGGFQGGFYPYGGYYGGFFPGGYGYGFGGYNPYFAGNDAWAYPADPVFVVPPPPAPARVVELSGQFPATLTLDFPAPAEVWLDGKEVAGAAATTRTLTSPVVRPGEQYTFHVKARWRTNGRTYEYARDVPLGPGERSRLLVVSGTAVEVQE